MSILERLRGARKSSNGWEARCPAHEDAHSSLSIAHRDGRWLLNCHAGCSVDTIVAAVGLKVSDLFDDDTRKQKANGKSGSPFIAEYIYKTADGEPSRKVCRTADKQFPQFKWTGSAWKGGVEGVPVLPYRLPELVAANVETPVYIPEGEKDCESLARLGFVATTNPMGAGKWRECLNQWFADRHVFILRIMTLQVEHTPNKSPATLIPSLHRYALSVCRSLRRVPMLPIG
jgi:putative DNA primase/helicase